MKPHHTNRSGNKRLENDIRKAQALGRSHLGLILLKSLAIPYFMKKARAYTLHFLGLVILLCSLHSNAQHPITDSGEVERMLDKSKYFLFEAHQPDSAREILEELIARKKEVVHLEPYTTILYFHYLSWRDAGQMDSAIVAGEKAKEACEEKGDTLWTGILLRMLSQDYTDRGRYSDALQSLHEAIDLFKQLGDTAWLIKTRGGISVIHHEMREYAEGIAYGEQTLELARSYAQNADDPQAWVYYMDILTFIAINYDDGGDPSVAMKYYRKAEEIKDLLPDSTYLGQTYSNMGNSLMKMEQFEEAERYALKALTVNLMRGRNYNITSDYMNLGLIAMKLNKDADAQSYLAKAEEYAQRLNNVEKLRDVYSSQFEYHNKVKQYDTAIAYLQKHHALKDSVLNLEKIQVVSELQTRYDTRQKEAAILEQQNTIEKQQLTLERNTAIIVGLVGLALLLIGSGVTWRVRVRKQQQQALQQQALEHRAQQLSAMIDSQEQERKRFASDLHDGFGQMISVLKLNVDGLQKGPETKRPHLFEQSASILNTMYDELKAICFNMMPHALTSHGLIPALKEFANRINASEKVSLQVNAFNVSETLDERIVVSLFRITQEWVNNILKHGNATSIEVQITGDNHEVTLTIEDNGQGFDKAILTHASGNGWKNILQRASLIGAQIDVDTRPGAQGSTFILNTPTS